jgi:catalase
MPRSELRRERRQATSQSTRPNGYRDPRWFVEAAEIMPTVYVAHKDDNDFIQPGTLYRQVMSPTERDHLVGNIVWNHPGARGEKLMGPGRSRPVSDFQRLSPSKNQGRAMRPRESREATTSGFSR